MSVEDKQAKDKIACVMKTATEKTKPNTKWEKFVLLSAARVCADRSADTKGGKDQQERISDVLNRILRFEGCME